MDKLKQIIKSNKKSIVFLLILMIIALISGSIFNIILNDSDKQLVQESIQKFLNSFSELNTIETLKTGVISQSIFIVILWLLGFSIIGIPIILFSFFCKIFIIGFSISSFVSMYNFKGCLLSLTYIFPHHIINIINYGFLTIISLKVSFSLLHAIVRQRKIDFKPIINQYLLSLGVSLILGLFSIALEVYLMPILVNLVV